MKVVGADEIRAALDMEQAIECVKQGFVAYSSGAAVIPPVGHLEFADPPGECHIKYGYVLDDDTFLIKVATGFYENQKLGLPNSNGLMLLLSATSGEPLVLFQDEGFLTDVRTAIAGSLCGRYLGPQRVSKIGIVGGGIQARFQLEFLQYATDCKDVVVWARRDAQVKEFAAEMSQKGFFVEIADSIESLCECSNLIVTTTAAKGPIVKADWIRPGTHITAMGSDGAGKQELDPRLFERADRCVVDSRTQCCAFGETSHALASGHVTEDELCELGEVIVGTANGRLNDSEITLADLTGVAVQDIGIVNAVWQRMR